MSENTRQQVREFYDRVGWSQIGEGLYQNARYEDLRPVSQEYISRCHLRINRYIPREGRFLLDAGSGPVQWPEYLTYSAGYQRRVCADISITALREARKRLGEKGLYVVADISALPFADGAFDGAVSLHAIHHVPPADQPTAYAELYRTLKPGGSAAVVNAWKSPEFMRRLQPVMAFSRFVAKVIARLKRVIRLDFKRRVPRQVAAAAAAIQDKSRPTGTHTVHQGARELTAALAAAGIPVEIYPWRSVSVKFLRQVIHPWLAGRWLLRGLYALEERYPQYFGENGQYPIIVLRKEKA